MSCEKLAEIKVLAIQQPESLESESWIAHLEFCDICRREVDSLNETLAVFCQLEKERLSQCPTGLTWDKLYDALAEQGGQKSPRRWTFLVAAVVGAFVVGSTTSWFMIQTVPSGGDNIAVNTNPPNVEGQQIMTFQEKPNSSYENIPKGVWGELRIKKDGSLEVVSENGDARRPDFQKTIPQLDDQQLSPPQAIPVSNR